jgi:next-to-BRCA1 protein 1
LLFLEDVTIPDYSPVSPGSTLDKQWLVQNSGSCNWGSRYRLRLISGDALGAPGEQALYPARAGMQALIRIHFTAPLEPGSYYGEWQAFDPNGLPFGESFAIRINVQP